MEVWIRCGPSALPQHRGTDPRGLLELFGFALLLLSLRSQPAVRFRSRCGDIALRLPHSTHLELNCGSSSLLLFAQLLSNFRLLLQPLLQSLLGRLRLLLEALLEKLLLLPRQLLLFALLVHECLEHPFVALIAASRRCRCLCGGRGGSAPILVETLLHHRCCGGRSATILDLLLHQLRLLLLLLLQKAKDHPEIGARVRACY